MIQQNYKCQHNTNELGPMNFKVTFHKMSGRKDMEDERKITEKILLCPNMI